MITARKNRLAEKALSALLRRVMRKRFHGIYVGGMEHIGGLDATRAVIFCVNHTNWWDGFVVQLLSREIASRESYLAQEEKHLARYRFFRWCGVFGIDLDGSPLAGLRYALRLLQDPATALWFFPQGRITPQAAPIALKEGAHFLRSKSGAQLLPVIFRYEWLEESRPSILVRIGTVMPPDASITQLQDAMQQLFTSMDAPIGSLNVEEFRPLIRPAMSLNKKWDCLVHRLCGRDEPFDSMNR